MKKKPSTIIPGLVVAGGAVLGGSGCMALSPRVVDLESRLNVPAEVEEESAKNPQEAAGQLWQKIKGWYNSEVKADSAVDLEKDVAGLGYFMQRIAALKKSQAVKGDAAAMAILGSAERFTNSLKSFYHGNVWKSGVIRIFVDAQDRKTGAYKNFGGTKIEGGYVFEASLEDARYVLAAAMLVPEADPDVSYMGVITGTVEELKEINKDRTSPKYANSSPEIKKALEESLELVNGVKREALTSAVLAGTDTSRRNKISEQVSYRQARALVHYFGNEWMRGSIDGLAPQSNGIFKASNEGLNICYIVGEVRMTQAEVNALHPNRYAPSRQQNAPAQPAPAQPGQPEPAQPRPAPENQPTGGEDQIGRNFRTTAYHRLK